SQLSFVLAGVVSQQLIPRQDGKGRVLAVEVMIPNAAIRNLIREDKTHQIYSQMQMGQGKFGNQTFNQSFLAHIQAGSISIEQGLEYTSDPDELTNMVQQWRSDRAGGGVPGPSRRGTGSR
ncbi:MAG: type IV pili twitching motility protein PilT, partial [Myxococcota bacterium]